MFRRVAGLIYAVLAILFGLAAAVTLSFVVLEHRRAVLAYALPAVFALGAAVCVGSARESFARTP